MNAQGGSSNSSSGSPGGGFTLGYRATRHFPVESGVDFRYGNLFPEVSATAQDSSGKGRGARPGGLAGGPDICPSSVHAGKREISITARLRVRGRERGRHPCKSDLQAL
jgi:hypothetical protein